MCDRLKKSGDLKSSIIKHAILVIHVHNWIRPTNQKGVPQKEKHDDNQMSKNVGLIGWL